VKIYTRTGDTGETALFDNRRVSKADPRVDAYGEVDELNAWLGLVRSACQEADIVEALVHIQRDLFAVGAQLADPSEKLAGRVTKAFVSDADVERLESLWPAARRPARRCTSLARCAVEPNAASSRSARRQTPSSSATSTGCPTCCSCSRGS
jgi:cob(I)alamin adenosyltransferase